MSANRLSRDLDAYLAQQTERLVALTRRRAEEIVTAARRRLDRARRPGGSGRLAQSLRVEPLADGGGHQVVTRVPYARFVEFGTRRMAARPFLTPAVAEVRDKADGAVPDNIGGEDA